MKGLKLWMILIIISTLLNASLGYCEKEFLKKGTEGKFSFLSGGVGQNERDFLIEKGKAYPLKLIFSNKKGEYLSNIEVKIFEMSNKLVLAATSEGPWFFLKAPQGIYRIEVRFKGEKKTIPKLQIDKGTQKVVSIQW